MMAGTRTLSLEDTFLEPQIIEPPPTRHALFILLLALTAMLQLGTTNWGDLYDGLEGQFAGGAREMLNSHQWLIPTNDGLPCLESPPLAYWLIAFSYKIFGVTAMAARLPIGVAMIVSIALTFLIGERLGGYWRGFSAGMMHLCFAGSFLLGRGVTAEPMFGALLAGAIYCAVCGYQRRQFRHAWFTGVWLCLTLACLTKGLVAVLYFAGICLLAAIFFREARLRFRPLFHWTYLLLFLALVSPWYVWIERIFPGCFVEAFVSPNQGLSRFQFLLFHFIWLFPASILILPGLMFAFRKVFRSQEITFADALPLVWMVVGFLPLLAPTHQSAYASISMWSGFALWSALIWERTPRGLQAAGLGLLILSAAILVGFVFQAKVTTWSPIRPLVGIVAGSIAIFAIAALYATIRQRSETALLLVLVAMVPVGLCLAEGASRLASSFSLASASRFLNLHLTDNGQVFFEGDIHRASSLTFYLNQKFFLVSHAPNTYGARQSLPEYVSEGAVLDGWRTSSAIYLIVDQTRLSYWQDLIVSRTHIFHQVTSCGQYAVLSNQM
jgi:4-amino-4-deoxy-L-arabinose transferase-like glycosyltransferase